MNSENFFNDKKNRKYRKMNENHYLDEEIS